MDQTLSHVRAVLATTAERWSALAALLPEDLLARPPAEGEWAALACLQHLVDTERTVFPVRLRAILSGQDFPAFDPDSQGTPPELQAGPRALAAELASLRAQSLAALEQVGEADLPRQARHAELGLVTLAELLNQWAGHDLMHTVQAERALLQPFIAGCGPWRSYFADHDASS